MDIWTVEIKETRYATAYIEAETEEEAERKARERWEEDEEGMDWSTSTVTEETFKLGHRTLDTCMADGCYPEYPPYDFEEED